jgi:protein-S-isoprenylcysteine O-methyltransferase Ste14
MTATQLVAPVQGRLRRRAVAYWTATALLVTESLVGGTYDLFRLDPFFAMLAQLGYPAYLATILGSAKILAGLTLSLPRLPRLKEWAYAGILINMLGAAASQIAVGNGPGDYGPPLVVAVIALTSWAYRPGSRRLAGPTVQPTGGAAMGRSAAVITSATWFVVTGGLGAVLVPWWLTDWRMLRPLPGWSGAEVVGIVLILAGLVVAMDVFAEFVRARGTPMPGAMTERLVVTGFNRYVRNPIYLAALTIFLGEALLLGQLSMVIYAIAVWAGAAAFVHWYEEPALATRFGADYEAYRRAVPPWRPRLHPWTPADPEHPEIGSGDAGAPGAG